MLKKVLIANRGAIACRILRTLHRIGVESVAVYSDADAHSLHVKQAGEAIHLGPSIAAESYLQTDRILDAARRTGAQAIHPGYGFLSENADFADACEQAGLVFLGPTGKQMREFGLKHTARALAQESGVPLLPGTGLLRDAEEAEAEAGRIGFPVMLKSSAGGGGIGMRLCRDADEVSEAFAAVERLSRTNFKDGGIYLEKFVERARHIEVQIFGDGRGNVLALGERDCSAQRRNQKVIEETPAPGLTAGQRANLFEAAVRLGRAVNYRSAGTVEFVCDADSGEFYFLEVNTRLQVEHGVTEEVTGVDLVEWMVRLGGGDWELPREAPPATGVSIQVRVYAEDPNKSYQPSAGLLTHVALPGGVRCDTWVESGTEVTPFYDPLLVKVIVRGVDRGAALERMQAALAATRLAGVETNLEFLRQVVAAPGFRDGAVTTSYLSRFHYHPRTFDVIEPGTMTTVQDYPGRLGYWDVGVPPSGPMDSLSFRLGNKLLGNAEGAPALECTLTGPTLRFNSATRIVIAGADMQARLDGDALPNWTAIQVAAGAMLELGAVTGPGARTYILFEGGLDVPPYMGSASTFTLGRFGGHGGRALRAGDVLHFGHGTHVDAALTAPPKLTNRWEIGVLYGPHGAPDFFTPSDIEKFFTTDWRVHYNSSRTGVRLIGPKPQWARKDGGEAGLHPSNIHDNAYAIGTVDFTGDMPVILGPDGPSLGGFVCPATIVDAELWKLGQLKPGDSVRFVRITEPQARELLRELDDAVALRRPLPGLPEPEPPQEAVLVRKASHVCRADGDQYLLLEYGENVLDLNLRFRVHALMDRVLANRPEGVIDLTPGIRSLHVHYDSRILSRDRLLSLLEEADATLPDLDDVTVPSRIVHLPLSWDDPATRLAIEKYMQSVRPDAPWCPSNIEFIRRINGLDSIDEVKRIVFDASYLVLGLGDVYLGAPVATPIDPRHRLVTTKYNPARTWTPENAVGIGGAYLCVYGMEGPGGYQFVGRTVQMWNTYRTTKDFEAGKPWLLRFFDQLRFYPVSAEELLDYRDRFPHGKFELRTEQQQFSLREYHAFLASIRDGAAAFKVRQQAAFEAERERWAAAGQSEVAEVIDDSPPPSRELEIPPGCHAVRSPATASVWRIEVQAGDHVTPGRRLLVLEAMKMEIAVPASRPGKVRETFVKQGSPVTAGQPLLLMENE